MRRATSGQWSAAPLAPPVTRHVPHLLILVLVACRTTLTPTAPPPVSPSPAVPPALTAADALTPTLPTSTTPTAPRELVICLADEPQSLYLYARPEPGRDHLLAALYDGPIDSHDYGYQPVLLTKLPSVADGDAVIHSVPARYGEAVVDALGRVVTLTRGTALAQADGTTITYGGTGVVSVPQMAVTFHLKPGVRWSDGAPLTADDSVFSFEVGLSPDSYNPRRDLAERTSSYLARDAATVEWTSLPGFVDPLYFTNFWTPLPRHAYGALKPSELLEDVGANRNPLGWGPFVLREWVGGDHLTFERNPTYFRASEGLPRLDRVTYRILPPDPTALLDDLQAGRCDVIPQNSAFDGATDGLTRLADMGGGLSEVRLQLLSAGTLEHLDFGIVPASDYARGIRNDFFAEVRVRRAFAYCLDRQALSRLVGATPDRRGDPPLTYLPANHPLHAPPPLAEYPFDPARGRALLAEVGWTDSDGDGLLDKEATPLRLALAGGPEGDSLRRRLMEAIQMQLKANCGIEIETRPLTRGELEGDWPDGVIFGRRFDLALFGWRVGSLPPCELFTTAQIPDDSNPGGANDTGYSNPAFDAACQRALATLDPGPSAQSHAEAQRLFADDLPVLPLFFRATVAAARPEVEAFRLDPTSPSELWNIEVLARAP